MLHGGIDVDSKQLSLVVLDGEIPHFLQIVGDKKEKYWQMRIFKMIDEWIACLPAFVKQYGELGLIGVEAPVMIQNPKTTMMLSEVDALVCKHLHDSKIQYESVQNLVWKKAILGTARVDKDIIKRYAITKYDLDWEILLKKQSQHCFDALCLAEYMRSLVDRSY